MVFGVYLTIQVILFRVCESAIGKPWNGGMQMASTDDLRFLARYAGLRRAIPGYETNDLISVIAALVWLDHEAGLDHPANMIIISEELSLFLPFWVRFTDPEINLLLCTEPTGNVQIDRAVADKLHEMLLRPVEVIFVDPRREQKYPVIQGLRRIVAVDSALGLRSGVRAYTVRRSGERIVLPK